MKKPNIDQCKTVEDAISLLKKYPAAHVKSFARKLSELLMYPDKIDLTGKVKDIFEITLEDISRDLWKDPQGDQVKELAFKIFQIQTRKDIKIAAQQYTPPPRYG